MLLKPNTMITILYDVKSNKTYTINTTSKKLYSHRSNFGNLKAISWIGYAFAMFFMPRIFLWIEGLLGHDIFLNDSRVVLIVLVVLMGLVLTLIAWKRRGAFELEAYLVKHKEVEEISNVNEILDKAYTRGMLIITITLVSLGVSLYQFSLFFEDSEFINFRNGLMAYAIFSLVITLFFDAIFAVKLDDKKVRKHTGDTVEDSNAKLDGLSRENNGDSNDITTGRVVDDIDWDKAY